MVDDVRIVKAGVERVDELEPLWKALQSHHHDLEGHIPGIPLRDLDTSWERRRVNYVGWLSEPDSFVLVAEGVGGHPVGCALVSVHSADDTHVTRDRFAELESLSVLPELRGAGLGSRLLEAVFEEVRGLGIREMVIGVLAANTDAARLYERYGFRPWVVKYMGVVPGTE